MEGSEEGKSVCPFWGLVKMSLADPTADSGGQLPTIQVVYNNIDISI